VLTGTVPQLIQKLLAIGRSDTSETVDGLACINSHVVRAVNVLHYYM